MLIRTGRLNQLVHNNPPQSSASLEELLHKENALIEQIMKTKAKINIWQLIASSHKDSMALLNSLTKMSVSSDTSPEGLANFMTTNKPIQGKVTSFTNDDLPFEANKHKKALHLTVACMGMSVPMTLVGNGSTINVFPLRIARRLGFKADLSHSHQGI